MHGIPGLALTSTVRKCFRALSSLRSLAILLTTNNQLTPALIVHQDTVSLILFSLSMADVLIENPLNTVPPHKKLPPSDSIPDIDSLEGAGSNGEDEYSTLKRLQRHLEYIQLQEEYIKDEQRSLKRELVRAQEEIKRIQSVPLVIGQFMEAIDQKYVIIHVVRFDGG